MAPRACVWVVLVFGLAAVGCAGRLDETKTATLDPAGDTSKSYSLRGQASDQTVAVEATSTASEINVFIVLESKFDAFQSAATRTRSELAAASAVSTLSASLSAPIPAKADARVIVELAGGKKTDITVKMTNKK